MRLESEQVLGLVLQAIQTGTPFSAIRLGDGEGRVMGFPDHVSTLDLAQIWKIWFGHTLFSDIQIKFIKDELKKACHAADVIGLPMVAPDFNSDFGRVEAVLQADGYFLPTTKLANSGFHLDWQTENEFRPILEGRTSIGVVGSRNIAQKMHELFGISEVLWAKVPPEMQYADLTPEEKLEQTFLTPHLYEKFHEVWNYGIPYTLSRGPGTVVLVGAGVLGKLYCARIKALGGIAIDVGSMMDLWAGLKTRNMPQFDGLRDLT